MPSILAVFKMAKARCRLPGGENKRPKDASIRLEKFAQYRRKIAKAIAYTPQTKSLIPLSSGKDRQTLKDLKIYSQEECRGRGRKNTQSSSNTRRRMFRCAHTLCHTRAHLFLSILQNVHSSHVHVQGTPRRLTVVQKQTKTRTGERKQK